MGFINLSQNKIQQICGELLTDCMLDIKFNHYPLSINLDFISNIKSQKISFECKNVSQLLLEKNSEDDSFYTVFEVYVKQQNGTWSITVLPEVDLKIKCNNLKVSVIDLTEEDIKNLGLK